ncbi:MAG: M48 family metalloprotease [Xanthomonadales bacterium]|nr:M48 family metalloprotease [Xanthomonadales bacterium]
MRRLTLTIAALFLSVTAWAASPTGKDLYEGFIARTPIYDDPELQAYITGLVEEIVSVSEKKGEKFTVTLMDDQAVNAFATRDNYVYVNRGLLHYVRNEAQLVSVLAHEVGHITKGHVTDLEDQAKGAQFLAALAGMLSGSPEVYEAAMAYSQSLVRSHGRSNELEADAAGAEYMVRLGYNTDAMIEMLSTMKDMETLQKRRAAERGATRQTYHGIFASHPRNDSRLRNAVAKAGEVDPAKARGDGAERYRRLTEGLVWGDNFQDKEAGPERWEDLNTRIRFDFPDGWTHQSQGKTVIGTPDEGGARLSMEAMARTPQGPEEYLYNYLDSPQLKEGREISPAGLKGFTGILKGEGDEPDKRIAVIYYRMGAYVFTGEVDDPGKFEAADELFRDAISTFRPISNRELRGRTPKRISWVKATSATTFDKLGEHLKLTQTELEDLRLINGYYPHGEPKPGEWIKIIKQEL